MSRAALVTPEKLQRLLQDADTARQRLPDRRMSVDVNTDGRIHVFISNPVAVSGATATIGGTSQPIKWTYTIKQAACVGGVYTLLTGGIQKTGVKNKNEIGNTTTVVSTGKVSNIPTGWEYCAISKVYGGLDIVKVGEAFAVTEPDGTVSWWIDEVNIVDGTCS